MEVPSDNSRLRNSAGSSSHTGEGIVIDIGTGDGRFVLAAARDNPQKFFIGIDANVKPLEKPSMKATRKASKGGLPNVLFVQAAVEDLPAEMDGCADEIHIHFPWGSLLKAVAAGEESSLAALRRLASVGCLLEIVIGIDPARDRLEIERLGVPELSDAYLDEELTRRYEGSGFRLLGRGDLPRERWARLATSWAKRLSANPDRRVLYLYFKAV